MAHAVLLLHLHSLLSDAPAVAVVAAPEYSNEIVFEVLRNVIHRLRLAPSLLRVTAHRSHERDAGSRQFIIVATARDLRPFIIVATDDSMGIASACVGLPTRWALHHF